MFDCEITLLFEIKTKRINEETKRNITRFSEILVFTKISRI